MQYKFSRPFIVRAATFTALYFLVVILGAAEVSRISNGKVKGLSANGGLDFFIAQSHIHRVDLNYDGWHWFIVVPAYSYKPRNGFYASTVPFYKQDYYYNLGWEYLRREPMRLLQNFEHIKNLFVAMMLPSRADAPGFTKLMPPFHVLKLVLLGTLGLYFVMWRDLGEKRALAAMMLCIIALTLFLCYWFTGEPRYTFSILFAFYLLGLKTIEWLIGKGRRAWKILGIYLLILAGATGSVTASVLALRPDFPKTIQVTGEKPGSEYKDVTHDFTVGHLHFPYSTTSLTHKYVEHKPFPEPTKMRFATDASVDAPIEIQLEILTSFPIEFWHNGQLFFREYGGDYFSQKTYFLNLPPGEHKFEILCDYTPMPGGFTIYYSYWQNDWQYRHPFGVSSDVIHFNYPNSD